MKSTRPNKQKGKGDMAAATEIEASSSASSSESEDTANEIQDSFLFDPKFRRKWRESEIPLCIVGSCVYKNCHLHLVRLMPENPDEVAAIESEPTRGITPENSVIVLGDQFRKDFPELTIKYYEKNLTLVYNTKTVDEKTEDAARSALLHQYTENKLKINGTPIFNEMMGLPNNDNQRPYYLNTRIRDEIDDAVEDNGLDAFGLPENYGESSESECNYDSSSSDDEDYVKVEIDQKKPVKSTTTAK